MATNMYLKFDPPLEAGSSAANHEKEIEVLSWSHGSGQNTSITRSTAGAGTVEQASHNNLTFTKYLDAATHSLLRNCWSGKQINQITLSCYRASGDQKNQPVQYLSIVMDHVIISAYRVSGGPGDLPVENVSLDYGAVQYNYVEQKKEDGQGDGNKPVKHDLEKRVVS